MEQIALQETSARRWFDLSFSSVASDPGPIRAELMSVERLEQYAETLAQSQPLLASSRHGRALLTRTRQNARVLRRHYESIAHTTSSQRSVTPAALPTWTSSAPPGSARPNRSNAPSSTASW